jgi:phosphoribosyl 1,2-cyclic phosphodiesterase
MIEAMTEGGFKKRGRVFCPADALQEDPVILKHAQRLPKHIEILKENSTYRIGEFEFKTCRRHLHPVETYGIKFKAGGQSISFISDTKYFEALAQCYRAEIIIVCVVFFQPRPAVEHLCLADVQELIRQIKPKKAVLTHFGMTMLRHKPHLLGQQLSGLLGTEVVSAYDGMSLQLS